MAEAMSESKAQILHKYRFLLHLFIRERDLLECARRYPAWRDKARELGFSDAKIDQLWPHQDAGRHMAYPQIEAG